MTETEKNRVEGGTLYLVATPIGNLSDLSSRAVKILTEVDFLCAEDTRVTSKLLSSLGITKSVVPYHDNNRHEKGPYIVRRLLEGESCALVSDAGTPAVSDPGEDLVRDCIEAGVPVTSVPGACAAITALTLSGMNTRRFAFEGFLEGRISDRKAALERIRTDIRTQIFYEAPHRLTDTLSLFSEVLGEDRRIALCRELTKLNEEVLRMTVGEALAYFADNEPRGEYVVVVEGYTAKVSEQFWADMTVEEHVAYYMEKADMKKMDAIKAAAKDRGVSKSDLYKLLL